MFIINLTGVPARNSFVQKDLPQVWEVIHSYFGLISTTSLFPFYGKSNKFINTRKLTYLFYTVIKIRICNFRKLPLEILRKNMIGCFSQWNHTRDLIFPAFCIVFFLLYLPNESQTNPKIEVRLSNQIPINPCI
jgi:hypothetical protein